MLFSEPKIPQSARSSVVAPKRTAVSVLFSEPKIPQFALVSKARALGIRFSALQRAENSSIGVTSTADDALLSFSALQRAENSSIVLATGAEWLTLFGFSALQRAENSSMRTARCPRHADRRVSVLFSEPKIPQLRPLPSPPRATARFQCSSASRKFLN